MPINCSLIKVAPEAIDFLSKISFGVLTILICTTFLTLVTCILCVFHLRTIFMYVSPKHRNNLLCIISANFPITSILCLIGLFVPRSTEVLSSAFIPLWQSACLFTFVFFVRDLFGGYDEMEKNLNQTFIKLASPPCCCCTFLPKFKPTRKNIKRAELLVTQAVFVRFLLILVRAVLFLNSSTSSTWGEISFTINLISMISGIISVWGLNIIRSFSQDYLSQYRVACMAKLLQLIIIICSIQEPIFNIFVTFKVMRCSKFLPAETHAKVWNHLIIVVEMFFISLLTTWFLRPTVNFVFDLYQRRKTDESV